MRALILAHGDAPSAETAQLLARNHDLIIVTDGAVHNAGRLAITPQYLVGDLDSARLADALAVYPGMRVIETPDQDSSDLEKAVMAAKGLGATSITVIGAMGGRADHTLANLAILSSAGVDMCLADEFGSLRAIDAESGPATLALDTVDGDTVSLVTFDRHTVVSIAGAKWPLNEFHLMSGTRGVSNIATGRQVKVTVHRGWLFVCHLSEDAVRLHSHHQKAFGQQK